jgi:hypothetical protein
MFLFPFAKIILFHVLSRENMKKFLNDPLKGQKDLKAKILISLKNQDFTAFCFAFK